MILNCYPCAIIVFVATPKEAKEAMRKTGGHGHAFVVKLRGLPYAVTEQQIEEFFAGKIITQCWRPVSVLIYIYLAGREELIVKRTDSNACASICIFIFIYIYVL